MKVQLVMSNGLVVIIDAASVFEAIRQARENGCYDVIAATSLSLINTTVTGE